MVKPRRGDIFIGWGNAPSYGDPSHPTKALEGRNNIIWGSDCLDKKNLLISTLQLQVRFPLMTKLWSIKFDLMVMVTFNKSPFAIKNKHKLLWTFSKKSCMIVKYHGG